LRAEGIEEGKWQHWQNFKDTIPNLQLMEGTENSSKKDTHFKDWLNGTDGKGKKNVSDINKFCADNFIPITAFEFSNFEEFYKQRKTLMTSELMKLLNLKTEELD
jgi:hypothetical protein